MKNGRYALLCFFTGIYFTFGGWGLFVFFMVLNFRLGQRNSIIDSETPVVPPYPFKLQIGFIASLVPLLKIGLLLIPIVCGYLLAREGINYWYSIPPMSSEKALRIANEETRSTSANVFKSIYWDKKNQL